MLFFFDKNCIYNVLSQYLFREEYYENIKEKLINNEINKKVKDYSKNKYELNTYYEVGKLLIDVQGGEKRAKYGNQLIKEYSLKLTKELGKGYSTTSLKRMRQFYLIIEKGAPMGHQLCWSHYKQLLKYDDINQINHYINRCINNNLSKRDLEKIIKSKEYERLPNESKLKIIKKQELDLVDDVKNPILIKNNLNIEKVSEKYYKN